MNVLKASDQNQYNSTWGPMTGKTCGTPQLKSNTLFPVRRFTLLTPIKDTKNCDY